MAKYGSIPPYGQINDITLQATNPPGLLYYLVVGLLAGGVGALGMAWVYQVLTGMGVAGIHQPVDWGVYIANFVFWVGIAHSGTLISAILHLVRAKWRDAVSRSSEAMTIFAVLTAGMFPMVHLGRVWVFYYLLPYPSERQLWPNFVSPLVWDVLAVSTYLVVSVIFFYVGLIPDLAAARDQALATRGPRDLRGRVYRLLALGWTGAQSQWRHYGRGYLYFAALATPLVISVHSIVSWDFAMGLLTGWHVTLFAPYFVAGAIHSGLAMVLTLMIPMRSLLGLRQLIRPEHLEMVAKTMLVTTAIMGYSYVVEPFVAWFTGNIIELQYLSWRASGWVAVIYWSLIPLNVLFPALFAIPRVRRSLTGLFLVSLAVNAGMWLERVMIITASTSHDYMPHTWSSYAPSWVEVTITVGSACFFFCAFLLFSRTLPTVPMADLKSQRAEQEESLPEPPEAPRPVRGAGGKELGVLAVYSTVRGLEEAVLAVRRSGLGRVEVYSPMKLPRVSRMLGYTRSPVRRWTLIGALSGMAGGFGLASYAASVNTLVVGGKPWLAPIPYMIPTFEGLVLCGALANLAGLIVTARLGHLRLPPAYRGEFSRDKLGLLVACSSARLAEVRDLLAATAPEELHVNG